MKKFIVIAIATLAFAATVAAQPRAIGIRGAWGAELSYQHSFGNNFIEGDLGWAPNSISVAAAYDFVFANVGICNFYAGPGAQIGVFKTTNSEGAVASGLNLGILGQVGCEFELPSVPVNISIDWRPVFNLINPGFLPQYAGVGIRYRF